MTVPVTDDPNDSVPALTAAENVALAARWISRLANGDEAPTESAKLAAPPVETARVPGPLSVPVVWKDPVPLEIMRVAPEAMVVALPPLPSRILPAAVVI